MQQLEIWMDGRSLSDNLLATYITALYQDGKSPSTISKIVAVVKWRAKNYSVGVGDFFFEITEKTLASIRRKGKSWGRRQVEDIMWDEVEGFISGHSLRVGSAVSLARAGASVADL